ncbi:MAG TPA: AMP-dependent synthetase/ligase, partial [Solirubrobacterales bacterium]|nr:AMP-dependent synthetase/ligase [Solirubrobacterales bacterium]
MSSTYTPTNRSRTLADLLPNSAARHGSDGAFLFKNEAGSWEETSYEKVAAEVQALTLGLKALGVQRGDKVAIIGNTRPEWTLFDFAAMSTGATVVPIYQSNSPSECQYVLEHSESRVVIAENEDQLAKIREVRDSLPALENVVIMIGEADDAISMNELRAKGDSGSAEDYKASYEAVEPDDLCKIVYTSGTTGPPKGCMISHGNYRAMLDMADSASIVEEGETSYLFLPLAHVFALLIQYGMIDIGGRIAFWERDQLKIVPNLAEVKPESFPSVPRIFEKVHDTAVATAEGEGGLKAAIFRWAFRVGKRYRKAEAQGKKPGFLLTKQFNFADKAVFSKIREIFGGNLRVAISGAAPIDPEILRFYEAAGVPLFEAWGMTETSTGGTTNMPGENRIGTVGKPVDGVELRIAEDGELLIKGDNVFQGYYKNPEATAETITDGWLHTGDIASIDEDGYVSIIGRKKEIIITAGGKNITPVNIEQEVKRHPLVSQCVVIGDRRPYLIALITLDQEALTRFAAEQGMLDEPGAMVGSPLVRETLEQHIEEVNRNFARVEQIKRFHILP